MIKLHFANLIPVHQGLLYNNFSLVECRGFKLLIPFTYNPLYKFSEITKLLLYSLQLRLFYFQTFMIKTFKINISRYKR